MSSNPIPDQLAHAQFDARERAAGVGAAVISSEFEGDQRAWECIVTNGREWRYVRVLGTGVGPVPRLSEEDVEQGIERFAVTLLAQDRLRQLLNASCALRPAARDRRSARLLGGAAGTLDGSPRQAAGDPGRGPRAGPRGLRGDYSPGEYGAGVVIVWDRGMYRNLTRREGRDVPAERALEDGHLVVELHGRKLRGAFALTRTGTDGRGRERWLLVKKRDPEADAANQPVLSRPESVLSGRTIEQLAAEVGWRPTRR